MARDPALSIPLRKTSADRAAAPDQHAFKAIAHNNLQVRTLALIAVHFLRP
jgi:hypothetical protein